MVNKVCANGTVLSACPLRCWAEIDLAALERNVRLIRTVLPPGVRYAAVVKADAYGHGLRQTAMQLARMGVDYFAVANISEAVVLREVVPDSPILLLSALLPDEGRFLTEYRLTAAISTAEEVARFDSAGRAAGQAVAVHLKIDTGMGRLGAWHQDAGGLYALIAAAPNLRLTGVFTHFASAEDAVFTGEQRRRFLAALGRCPGLNTAEILIHADSSASIGTMPYSGPFNMVRIGGLQYGIIPLPGSPPEGMRVEPTFSLHTRIGLIKALPRGMTVSYGRTHTLTRDSQVAVLCAGYGDGVPRAVSSCAEVLVHGQRCAVLGRVTMDQTVVDITDVGGAACGDPVVLFGRQGSAEISIEEFSRWAKTIPRESLCSITQRVPRIYRQGRDSAAAASPLDSSSSEVTTPITEFICKP